MVISMEKRRTTILIIVAASVGAFSAGVGFTLLLFSDTVVSDHNDLDFAPISEADLLRNSKTIEGVQIFLDRYPAATIDVHKGSDVGKIHKVKYKVNISDEDTTMEPPYILLTAILSAQGFPQNLELQCWNGMGMVMASGTANVESSLEKYMCESEIPELNFLVPYDLNPTGKEEEQEPHVDVDECWFDDGDGNQKKCKTNTSSFLTPPSPPAEFSCGNDDMQCDNNGDDDSVSSPVYLSRTVSEWKAMSGERLGAFYEHNKEFFTELGSFLIKDEIKNTLEQHGIKNKHDGFRVFSGNMLTSLPPYISYSAVVNATDGFSYYFAGGTHANTVSAPIRMSQLIFYEDILDPSKTSAHRKLPYMEQLEMKPQVFVVAPNGTNSRVHPHSLILDLEQNNKVTFYNNHTEPIRIQESGTGQVLDEYKLSWKTDIIQPGQSATVSFDKTGLYEWDASTPPEPFGTWWDSHAGGQVAAVSQETESISDDERMDIARAFLHNAQDDLHWNLMGSNPDGIVMNLSNAIFYMIPDAQKYYEARAHEWVPFDVPINIGFPKSLESER